MFKLILSLIALLSVCAQAEIFPGSKNVKEIPTNVPGVYKFHITEDGEYGQAAIYAEPVLTELFARTRADKTELKYQADKAYKDNGCNLDGTMAGEEEGGIYCGDLSTLANPGNTVLWSYGRGGWASAAATYKTFLTFTSAGTGSFTEAVIELTTNVSVEAITQGDAPNPIFEVVIDMTKAKAL